jgi:purine-binding chemotaxis protein CheW
MDILIFSVCDQNFGFELSYVKRVIRAVKVTTLPNAARHLLGIINLQGNIIPVINFRNVLGFEEREIEITDQFIICNIAETTVAFWVDKTEKVTSCPQEQLTSSTDSQLQHVIKNENGVVLIYNLKSLLDIYHVETKAIATC